MYSSLPSASKIYQNSVKPRQKSATSAKKRRKKVHSSSNQHVNLLEDSVISLVGSEQDFSGALPVSVVESPENPRERRLSCPEKENSFPDIDNQFVETCGVDLKSTDAILEQNIHPGIVCDIKDIPAENFSGGFASQQNEILLKKWKENKEQKLIESSVEENSEISCPVLIDNELSEEFETVLSSKIFLDDSDGENLSSGVDSSQKIMFDSNNKKEDDLEMTFEETEISVENECFKEFLNEAAQLTETKEENLTPPGYLNSNVSIESSESGFTNPTNSENLINDFASNSNINYKENDSYTSSIENVIQSDSSHNENSSHINVISSAHKENTNSIDINVIENQLNIIPPAPDSNSNSFSDNINSSNENTGYLRHADLNDQNFEVLISKKSSKFSQDNFDFSVRTLSPEPSELSCTESLLSEAKNDHQENSHSEIKSNSLEESEYSNLCSQKQDFELRSSFHISQSSSNLLYNESKTIKSSHSSSLPEDLHLAKKIMNKHSQSEIPAVFDKATLTDDLECENSTEEYASERNFSTIEDKNKSYGHRLSENSISGSEGMGSLWNVLPPLAMVKARTRSYVFGCKGPTGSLLGIDELNRFFPDKQITVFVGTWNMNGHDPPQSIDDFLLPLAINTLPDIYAIGIQESMQSRLEWEVLLQTTLGPSHVLFTSTSLGVLHLCIFLRRDLIWFCSEPEEASVATRPGTMVKTKGAIAVCFMCFGTSLLFVNSHLTAHEQKLKERLSDYEKIVSSLELPKSISLKNHSRDKDVTSQFDCVFWCGDLNFRVMHDRPSVLSFVEEKVRNARPSCSFLVKHDQLHKAMKEGHAFHGFKESVIHFIPSYKFDVGTSTFNSSKLRVPSYTDRILYRSKEKSSISCLHYNAVPDISTSDHKPVYAVFKVTLKPGRDNVPLAAGMFKRDVYLEAIKRRSKFLEVCRNQGQSAICSVM